MKKVIIFSLFVWLMPQVIFAAVVTKNILNELGFYDKSWQGFLQESDATTWQCGEIAGDVVRYRVDGDVIGYDEVNHVWWHLFTPVSTVMPIEALALRMSKSGKVTSQTVTLRESVCKSQPKHNSLVGKTVEELVMTERPIVMKKQETVIPVVEKPRVKTALEKVVVEPVVKAVTAERKTVPAVQQRRKKVQKNTDTLTVSSTWELMKMYRQETGEER